MVVRALLVLELVDQGEHRVVPDGHFGLPGIEIRVNAKLAFDPVAKRIVNHPEANAMLDGLPPRAGWEQYYRV